MVAYPYNGELYADVSKQSVTTQEAVDKSHKCTREGKKLQTKWAMWFHCAKEQNQAKHI